MKKTVIICLALLSAPSVFNGEAYSSMLLQDSSNFASVAGPRLLYPVTDNIVLTGKDELEFKWTRTDFVDTGYFDFRIYKGRDTTEANLILKEKVSPEAYPIKVSAKLFEVGQAYTWVLVQVFNNGQKSERSRSAFKIIAK